MDCKQIQKNLAIFLEDGLNDAESLKIKMHLGACLACSKELDSLTKTWGLLDKMPQIEPSPDFSKRFYNLLDERESSKRTASFMPFGLSLRLAPALVTVVIVLFFVNLYYSSKIPIRKSQVPLAMIVSSDKKEEQEVMENFELLDNLELLQALKDTDFELLENLDVIEKLSNTAEES